MKTIHVTGIELAPDGRICIRTVTVVKRWWQRRKHHIGKIYFGNDAGWFDSRGKLVRKSTWRMLDHIYADHTRAAMTDPVDRHTGYDEAKYSQGPVNVVSRPSVR